MEVASRQSQWMITVDSSMNQNMLTIAIRVTVGSVPYAPKRNSTVLLLLNNYCLNLPQSGGGKTTTTAKSTGNGTVSALLKYFYGIQWSSRVKCSKKHIVHVK